MSLAIEVLLGIAVLAFGAYASYLAGRLFGERAGMAVFVGATSTIILGLTVSVVIFVAQWIGHALLTG